MYRAVALYVKRRKIDIQDEKSLKALCLDLDLKFLEDGTGSRLYAGKEDISSAIRTPEMDMLSSRVSAVGQVREAMTELQRKVGREGSLVAEGRDMGSVVFPDAQVKIFLTASPEERARRRYNQLKEKGLDVNLTALIVEIRERDERDRNRSVAPLQAPAAALEVESTALSIEEVLERVLGRVRKTFPDLKV